MRVRMLGIALVAVLAIGGVAAGAASALPTTLTFDEQSGHIPLSPGEGIRMVTETPVVIEAGETTVECQDKAEDSAFFGSVVSNGEKTDAFAIASGGFMPEEFCDGTGPLGGGEVVALGFPWNLSVNLKGKVKLTGSPKLGIEVQFAGGAKCVYEKGTIRGALSPTPIFGSEQRADFQFVKQGLRLTKAASTGPCAKTAALSVEFPEVISEANNQYVYDIANTIY